MLKILACVTMLIDHVGYSFFPRHTWLRIVGRMAFPIFAYYIAIGFSRTRSRVNYLARLAGWGVVSQIPYSLLFYKASFSAPLSFFKGTNVMVTFVLAFLGLWALSWGKGRHWVLQGLSWIGFAGCAAAAHYAHTDYGAYGVGMVLLFHLFFETKSPVVGTADTTLFAGVQGVLLRWLGLTTSILLLTAVSMQWMRMHRIQLLCVAALPLILLPLPDPKPGRWKHAFYAFYPAHITILWLIHVLPPLFALAMPFLALSGILPAGSITAVMTDLPALPIPSGSGIM